MKSLMSLAPLFIAAASVCAQTDGISYQAVIIAPYVQELPGVDVQGNILPNAAIAIRFTILDVADAIEFQEEQFTQTDEYGRINLVIGSAEKDAFSQISWDGTTKNLLVEIDFESGGNYLELSKQELLFVPYAYHRNITATGTLKVDGPTELFSSLRVHNNTILERNLTVQERGTARFFGKVRIDSTATFYDNFTVDSAATATFLGPVEFGGPAAFNAIQVDGSSDLNGQVTIDFNTGDFAKDTSISSYPLLLQGSAQGIAIKVNGNRSIDKNYISFWDGDSTTNRMWGRIEGISDTELETSDAYIQGLSSKNGAIWLQSYNYAKAGWEFGLAISELVAASTSSTVCAGVGACVTAPIPSQIIVKSIALTFKAADLVLTGINHAFSIAERVQYDSDMKANIGVTYASGAGDYAEWLPKQNPAEVFSPGQLVGIKNGYVTKNTWGVEKIMIVSTRPIVLGNMPQQNDEKYNVKIAFMGQVPVEVLGKVAPGDYILPDVLGNGFAIAKNPKAMSINDYKKVAGVAWNIIGNIADEFNLVNVAVGINANDLSDVIVRQEEEIKALRQETKQLAHQMAQSNTILSDLVPGYAEAAILNLATKPDHKEINEMKDGIHDVEPYTSPMDENDVVYFEISKESIKDGLSIARQLYVDMLSNSGQVDSILIGLDLEFNQDFVKPVLIPMEEHPFWQRMDNDPAYKEEIVHFLHSNLEKAYHTHKEHAHNFTNLEVRK